MKQKLIAQAVRMSFRDAAYQFRMGAGFPGDVNRTHPVEIENLLMSENAPPNAFGQFVLLDAADPNTVRRYGVADAHDSNLSTPWGVTVRPYPFQQQSGGMSAAFGAAAPGSSPPAIDVMRSGLIMAQLNDITATPNKGDPIFIWCAATSGIHIQGGIETQETSGSTVELSSRYVFNGPPDSQGVVEISANV